MDLTSQTIKETINRFIETYILFRQSLKPFELIQKKIEHAYNNTVHELIVSREQHAVLEQNYNVKIAELQNSLETQISINTQLNEELQHAQAKNNQVDLIELEQNKKIDDLSNLLVQRDTELNDMRANLIALTQELTQIKELQMPEPEITQEPTQ